MSGNFLCLGTCSSPFGSTMPLHQIFRRKQKHVNLGIRTKASFEVDIMQSGCVFALLLLPDEEPRRFAKQLHSLPQTFLILLQKAMTHYCADNLIYCSIYTILSSRTSLYSPVGRRLHGYTRFQVRLKNPGQSVS